ncbi:C2H2 type zinc finger-containing protein [Stachybotrys elegans]|uniref:C2H2 type zinc finger-containing protein n=1 Tax=Stachybotrys elegans TaxID=80388 RepID=A0A8K0T367_9HYPO|nr:C2H2 type zinc finger-containing protein [Stachybotrys elegans]
MASINELDQFVNWDHAGAAVGTSNLDDESQALVGLPSMAGMSDDLVTENINLALENVTEDDFSFCALQHFSGNSILPSFLDSANSLNMSTVPMDTMDSMDFWDTPESPCVSCALSGYSCKRIREGRHKGFCTSCVALTIECSFGGVIPASLDPSATRAFPLAEPLRPVPRPSSTDVFDNSDNDAAIAAPKPGPPPKIGARFSRESVRILKNWLSTHNRHPYPSDEEKEMLQRQTGLNKTQITNWLANARRRGKVQPPRATSPHPANWSGSIDIPQRRGTPALEAMNPLQRWEHSPPENEPASVTAIARAVTASSSALSSGLNSPFSLNYTDDGSSRSLCNQSSASSLGTSHSSNGSFGSAYSHGSRNSWGSFGSAPFNSRNRRRRRRRGTPKLQKDGKTSFDVPLKTFQCTFCTETFRTKHDWQRHEKSLHLSLERWVCAPEGARTLNPETGQMSCVFCGISNPDDAHIESHNHSACQERTLEERTFYRKDHLNQHLRLVHNVKFMDWSMKHWKVATPEIRSRCGFCGIVMDTWTIRVDHLADHFKTGYSMADWKGDWGFDVPVLDMVENSIPPYLIHHERTTPLPFVASSGPAESPRNAYELIKLELDYFAVCYVELHGCLPSDEQLMIEGCRIIFASELLSLQGIATQPSWLRDLIMKSVDLEQKARFGPLRQAAENRLATLKINGKDNLFEQCPMEYQLQEFVRAKRLLGLTAMDDELQEEACRIVGRVEEVSTHPSEAVANWLVRLIMSGTNWLEPFRRRAHLPRSEDVQDEIIRSTDPKSIDSTIHSYSRLERELGDYLELHRSLHGVEPSDEDLQRQARIIIYEFDDGWNQTAADNLQWLEAFKKRHSCKGEPATSSSSPTVSTHKSAKSVITENSVAQSTPPSCNTGIATSNPLEIDQTMRPNPFFLNDANCYRRLAKELQRWVHQITSPNNPNCHVPTDAELQHQARWILYDDDDPWNQTAADNAEWLLRFKREAGMINDEGPKLPVTDSWALEQGGSGFAPPYAYPKGKVCQYSGNLQFSMRQGAKAISTDSQLANSFVENLTSRYPRPGTIFCSRELENGLSDMVEKHASLTGALPPDEAMRARAREITNASETAADDPVLLGKFKDWMRERVPVNTTLGDEPDQTNARAPVLNLSDADVDKMLQNMDFDFDTQDMIAGSMEGLEDAGGVPLTGQWSTF